MICCCVAGFHGFFLGRRRAHTHSNKNPFDLIHGQLVPAAVVKAALCELRHGWPLRLLVPVFRRFQIRGDPGRFRVLSTSP